MEYDLNVDDITRRYLAGETLNSIAEKLGCCRKPIIRRLLASGVALRSGGEVRKNMWKNITSPVDRARIVSAAHDAIRGKRQSREQRIKTAKTREIRQIGKSPGERLLGDLLRARGLTVTHQKAVGVYNVDIAIHEGSIGVEIFGGGWHNSGRHAARFRKRCDHLIDEGWIPVIIWASAHFPLEQAAVEYLVSLSERVCSGESVWRQEHVIRGDGHNATFKHNLKNGAVIRG